MSDDEDDVPVVLGYPVPLTNRDPSGLNQSSLSQESATLSGNLEKGNAPTANSTVAGTSSSAEVERCLEQDDNVASVNNPSNFTTKENGQTAPDSALVPAAQDERRRENGALEAMAKDSQAGHSLSVVEDSQSSRTGPPGEMIELEHEAHHASILSGDRQVLSDVGRVNPKERINPPLAVDSATSHSKYAAAAVGEGRLMNTHEARNEGCGNPLEDKLPVHAKSPQGPLLFGGNTMVLNGKGKTKEPSSPKHEHGNKNMNIL